jgi:pimeloyl-ACP methyl ester carboxylesterase
MNNEPSIAWEGLFGLALILSVVTTFLVALFLRRIYRKRIKAYMLGQTPTPRPPEQRADSRTPVPQIELLEYDSPPDLSPKAETLYRIATRTPMRAAVVFALAGVAHAGVATVVKFLVTETQFYPKLTVATIFAHAWPVLPTVVIVALANRRMQFVWPALFVAAVLLVSGPYRTLIAALWLTQMLVPTAAMFVVANWWMKSIGPVMLVFMSVFFFGLLVSPFAAYNAMHRALGLDNASLILMVMLFLVLLFTLAACVFLARVGRRYAGKRVSDQLLVLNLYWLLVTVWQCLLLAPEYGAWAATGLLAYVAYRLVLAVGLRRFRSEAEGRENVKLLLLRVFGSASRSERALEELGLRWRYAGSIQLIAGEDLALANLEPDELVDFLTLRLSSHFVKNREQLARKESEVDLKPDPDGRFRVNEFFCDNAIWREALLRLVGKNDLVLMDLRGFGGSNMGVVYELTQLINVKPMHKTVMIFDSTTDMGLVRQVLSEAWHRMRDDSPNPRTPAEPLRMLRVERQNSREARRLLRVLCAAAAN